MLRFNIDAFVITTFIGLTAVTHFNIAGEMVRYFVSLVIAFIGVSQPVFSRQHGAGDREAIKETLFFATKISIFVASFVGFGLIAWGRAFIQRWMGTEYLDAYPCLAVLVTGYLIALWQNPSVSLLYGTSRHKFYALFNSIEGVCNLILSILLVKPLGILGVALGTCIPMVLIKLIAQPIYVCRTSSIAYVDYVRMMLRTLRVVSLALTLPLFLTIRYLQPTYSNLVTLGIVSVCSYTMILWYFGFSLKEKDILRQAIAFKSSSPKRIAVAELAQEKTG